MTEAPGARPAEHPAPVQHPLEPLHIERLRAEFPALSQQINGQPLVYLDNAATVQKPRCVLDELLRCYTESCANVHRGAHTLAERASEGYERARTAAQRLLHAPSADEIVFTSGCTAAINLVAQGWGNQHVSSGDEILVTSLEHHSNLLPWQELCQRRGATLRSVPLDADGQLDLSSYARLLGPRTRLVAVAHVSNALGTLNPVAELARLAHAAGALILVDGAQAVARCPVDVAQLGSDFYVFSGHKVYAPFGLGVLHARRELLEVMAPAVTGGGMVELVEADRSSYVAPPRRFEAGTPNLSAALGLERAIAWLEALGLARVQQHEQQLLAYARALLAELPGVRLIGGTGPALGVVSLVVDGVHAHDVSTVLDRCGIAVRAGHHCAQPVMRHFGVPATVRASFAVYNTQAEIDALARGLARVRDIFGG
jgi:cysteine desulfurase / selenocysteine lyase